MVTIECFFTEADRGLEGSFGAARADRFAFWIRLERGILIADGCHGKLYS